MKKIYQKPVIKTEKMFERTVLACNKCPGNGNSTGQCGGSTKFT